jgi:hypothetical protein
MIILAKNYKFNPMQEILAITKTSRNLISKFDPRYTLEQLNKYLRVSTTISFGTLLISSSHSKY